VHLEDATERYEAEGLPHDEAVQTAIDHLGKSEAIGAGLRPQQTSRTWILAALPFAGLAMAGASARVANILHERGDRLWSSPLYTSVWLIGWLSIVLLCGSGAALFVRHRGLLARKALRPQPCSLCRQSHCLCFTLPTTAPFIGPIPARGGFLQSPAGCSPSLRSLPALRDDAWSASSY
jgi:hypothetical protein